MIELNKIYNEDCLIGMKRIKDRSIDMILCDLPYGVTARNKWDQIIPFDELWEHYNRIIKDDGAIVLFANGMFTADLMQSNRKNWKYNLVWGKVLPSGHLNAKKQPMREHEDICVFYKKQPTYNPQMVKGKPSHSVGKAEGISQEDHSRNTNYGEFKKVQTEGDMKYPKSILTFQKPHPSTTIHPTQKPVELCEWLIKTYTNEGETVLDNCAGSGTTLIAALNTNRNFIGFELEEEYYNGALERIENTYKK
ncbi:site-specific DNA-methyltransferase [uncultured Metabacillus sp.]|uniref:DNA-methyltransferase n=1 Tax=uncultured Metabacillus sp. TaxID=2860135 RepID=UPI003457FE23